MVATKGATNKVEPAQSRGRRGGAQQLQKNTAPSQIAPVQDGGNPDMVRRDPKGVNAHITILFEEVLAEPSTSPQSIDCVWVSTWTCYNCCKNFWYKLVTLFCACPLVMAYGLFFSQIACPCVWCITPCCKILNVHCVYGPARLFRACLRGICNPFFEACGTLFWAFSSGDSHLPSYRKNNGTQAKGVQFNDKVKTKKIPARDTNKASTGVTPRRTSVVPPSPRQTNSPGKLLNVKPAAKPTAPVGKKGKV